MSESTKLVEKAREARILKSIVECLDERNSMYVDVRDHYTNEFLGTFFGDHIPMKGDYIRDNNKLYEVFNREFKLIGEGNIVVYVVSVQNR